jgi:hypothetical protein
LTKSSICPSRRTALPNYPHQASLVKITNSATPKTPLPPSKLVFGKTFTDHMLTVDWNSNTGWAEPKLETCELDRVIRSRWEERKCGLLNLVGLTGAIVIARDRRTSQFGPFFRRLPLCLLSVSTLFHPIIPMSIPGPGSTVTIH